MVIPANPTVAAIKTKVRRLTASPGTSSLTEATLEEYINDFYNGDFPYAIKIDQMRSVYSFYTVPNVDYYPIDVNYNQGIRAPVYFEGIQGQLFKDRQQFYNMWPRFPTQFQPINGDGTTASFSFTIPGPFLANNVVLGGTSATNAAISVADDGNGNLQLQVPNPQVSVPVQTSTAPGMKNLNTGNPGQNIVTNIGTVNYVTGAFSITFPAGYIPASGTQITAWVAQYSAGRPYCLLFWNNFFLVRPVPDKTYKVEVETFLTPVQFLQTTDVPIVNQWWQYIAYGVACEIMRDRNDFEAVSQLQEGFQRQEGLVLERQAVEEIGQRNATLFSSAVAAQGWNQSQGWY